MIKPRKTREFCVALKGDDSGGLPVMILIRESFESMIVWDDNGFEHRTDRTVLDISEIETGGHEKRYPRRASVISPIEHCTVHRAIPVEYPSNDSDGLESVGRPSFMNMCSL